MMYHTRCMFLSHNFFLNKSLYDCTPNQKPVMKNTNIKNIAKNVFIPYHHADNNRNTDTCLCLPFLLLHHSHHILPSHCRLQNHLCPQSLRHSLQNEPCMSTSTGVITIPHALHLHILFLLQHVLYHLLHQYCHHTQTCRVCL